MGGGRARRARHTPVTNKQTTTVCHQHVAFGLHRLENEPGLAEGLDLSMPAFFMQIQMDEEWPGIRPLSGPPADERGEFWDLCDTQ